MNIQRNEFEKLYRDELDILYAEEYIVRALPECHPCSAIRQIKEGLIASLRRNSSSR